MSAHGPYTPIYKAGGMYFISGQIGVDANTKQSSVGIEGQTKQVIENLKAVLATEGLKLTDVAKTTIFLQNIADYQAVNEIYMQYFTEPRPARSCVEVSALPQVSNNQLLIEIEAVATRAAA